MTTYTNITKPSGTSYTNSNSTGKEQYDQASITYDDVSVFYDGINYSAYTNIGKPIPLGTTWEDANFSWVSATIPWSSGSEYTKVSKPT